MSNSKPDLILDAYGLFKTYKSGPREIPVLKGVDLSVQSGETISIRGESGSGKSTLLNLLAGIEIQDKGEIFWNKKNLGEIAESRLPGIRASYLGFVFQSFYLIPELNTLENVVLAARIAGKSPKDAVSAAEHSSPSASAPSTTDAKRSAESRRSARAQIAARPAGTSGSTDVGLGTSDSSNWVTNSTKVS